MKQAALAVVDWFIPNASAIEGSEIGLARTFVVTHLLGPFLIQAIVVLVYFTDPNPGVAVYAMMAAVAIFWILPYGLRLTKDLSAMALISVELLCATSLIGTSFYGGVNSPFLPWLLVSLMLGFFYNSDHALLLIALFAVNIMAAIAAHLLHSFPQHLSPAELATISWLSVFSATVFMSVMAIYYARIVTMSSDLERETERHRLMASRLRQAKRQAETASHGKTVFLAKIRRDFEQPLSHVVATSQALVDRTTLDSEIEAWKPEVERISAAGRRLLELVRETVDPSRIAAAPPKSEQTAFSLQEFVDRVAAASLPNVVPYGHELVVDCDADLGWAWIDEGRLRQALDVLIAKTAAWSGPGMLHLEVRRRRKSSGDWIEFQIRSARLNIGRHQAISRKRQSGEEYTFDPDLERAQMSCAILGGSFSIEQDTLRGPRVIVEIPAVPLEESV